MQNWMFVLNLFVFHQKWAFWANLVQEIKIISLRSNVVLRLIRNCISQCCSSPFLFLTCKFYSKNLFGILVLPNQFSAFYLQALQASWSLNYLKQTILHVAVSMSHWKRKNIYFGEGGVRLIMLKKERECSFMILKEKERWTDFKDFSFYDLDQGASIVKEKKLQSIVSLDRERTYILIHRVNQFRYKVNLWEDREVHLKSKLTF